MSDNSNQTGLFQLRRVAVVVNPIAGRGRGRKIGEELMGRLDRVGISGSLIINPPEKITSENFAAIDAMVVIGGDGTLRSVMGRCLELRGEVPAVLTVPMGTANLMGKHLGIKKGGNTAATCDRVMATLKAGKIRYLDAGLMNGKLFLLVVGVGIDATIVHALHRMRKGPIQLASYLFPSAKALAGYEYSAVAVWIDGEKAFGMAPGMVFVGNVQEYGTGFPMLPGARSDDGLLDVCVIPVKSRGEAIQKFLHAMIGEHVLGEGVVFAKGKNIRIESEKAVEVQMDGDPAGLTPVEISLLPARLPFIVPV
jgi:diacylglycerol kinase (ATP)